MAGLLYKRSIDISNAISLVIPSLGQVLDSEDDYFQIICLLIATPFDMMVQLDDAHIDFTKIDDFDLFLLLFESIRAMDTSLVFGELDLSGMVIAENESTNEVIIMDKDKEIVIDKVVHAKLSQCIRDILHIERHDKKPGNDEARKYLIDRERRRLKRHKSEKKKSRLENYVVALVNTEQFPYNYETVRDISIYQFYASLNQIAHKIKFDNTMVGFYAGTVKLDDLPPTDRTWILEKN